MCCPLNILMEFLYPNRFKKRKRLELGKKIPSLVQVFLTVFTILTIFKSYILMIHSYSVGGLRLVMLVFSEALAGHAKREQRI